MQIVCRLGRLKQGGNFSKGVNKLACSFVWHGPAILAIFNSVQAAGSMMKEPKRLCVRFFVNVPRCVATQ
jgi:hypothetical protein